MNDDRKRTLERFFDGELPDEERARVQHELTADADAAEYIEQLRRLRDLARAFESSDAVPPSRVVPGPWSGRPTRRRWIGPAVGGLVAAGIVAAVWLVGRDPDAARPSGAGAPPAVVNRAVPEPRDLPPVSGAEDVPLDLDAQRYEWANGELASPVRVAKLVIDQGHRRGQRSSTEMEIFALELANSPDESPRDVGRVVAERTSSMRHPPLRGRAERKPAQGSPPAPSGFLREGTPPRKYLIA